MSKENPESNEPLTVVKLLDAAEVLRIIERARAGMYEHMAACYSRDEMVKYFQDRAALLRAQNILIWQTAPNHSRSASCVAEADIDAEDHPERDPQKGQ